MNHPRPWRRASVAAAAFMLALAGCATLDEQQRKWIFQPSKHSWWGGAPAAEGMQDVWIEFDSRESGAPVRLHGLWLPQARADAPVLLYLHGARWDVRGSAYRMRRMHELGFAVLGIDYRGFGQSTRRRCRRRRWPTKTRAPPGTGWRAQHPQPPRYVFGHSLGSAIAVQLASRGRRRKRR